MLNHTLIEDTIYGWVRAYMLTPEENASQGLALYWADQNEQRTKGNHATIRIGDITEVSQYTEQTQDLTAVGSELTQRIHIQYNWPVSVECFTREMLGPYSARAVILAVRGALYLPVMRKAFRDIGMVIRNVGGVANLSGLDEAVTDYVGRALLEVNFAVADVVDETSTYIQTVEITPTVSGG